MPQTPPTQERRPLEISPRGGAVGTEVTLSATGLAPLTGFLIAFANLQQYQLLQRVTTDEDGAFTTTEKVTGWARTDGVHYFFASYRDEIPRAFSKGFHVTAADGMAHVAGTIGASNDGCVDLDDDAETLYHLVGDVGAHKPGDHVTVVGTIAGPDACAGTGIAISVVAVTPAPR